MHGIGAEAGGSVAADTGKGIASSGGCKCALTFEHPAADLPSLRVEQSRRSFASHLRRVREAVVEFGDEDRRASALRGLSEVEHKIAMKGEASRQTLERIERHGFEPGACCKRRGEE